jgi:hypothetical protein
MKARDYDMQVLREATHFVAFIQLQGDRRRAETQTYTAALALIEEWQEQCQTNRKGIVYAVNAAGRQVCVDDKMIEQLILEKQS